MLSLLNLNVNIETGSSVHWLTPENKQTNKQTTCIPLAASVIKFYARSSALKKKWKSNRINNQVTKATFYELCCLGAYSVANGALFKKEKNLEILFWEQVQKMLCCL